MTGAWPGVHDQVVQTVPKLRELESEPALQVDGPWHVAVHVDAMLHSVAAPLRDSPVWHWRVVESAVNRPYSNSARPEYNYGQGAKGLGVQQVVLEHGEG